MNSIKFVVLGNPIPWRRARRKGERYYTHHKVEEYQEEIIAAYLEARHSAECWPTAAMPAMPKGMNVGLTLRFYRQNRRRVDLDNLEKMIMDALGGWRDRPGYIWQDDSQIREKHGYLSYDKENPRVEIEAWNLEEG